MSAASATAGEKGDAGCGASGPRQSLVSNRQDRPWRPPPRALPVQACRCARLRLCFGPTPRCSSTPARAHGCACAGRRCGSGLAWAPAGLRKALDAGKGTGEAGTELRTGVLSLAVGGEPRRTQRRQRRCMRVNVNLLLWADHPCPPPLATCTYAGVCEMYKLCCLPVPQSPSTSPHPHSNSPHAAASSTARADTASALFSVELARPAVLRRREKKTLWGRALHATPDAGGLGHPLTRGSRGGVWALLWLGWAAAGMQKLEGKRGLVGQ